MIASFKDKYNQAGFYYIASDYIKNDDELKAYMTTDFVFSETIKDDYPDEKYVFAFENCN